MMVKEEKLKAVAENDANYDGKFYYAVKSTGVYCRPSCKSKMPRAQNIEFFESSKEAERAGYRPCKRCRPDLINGITYFIYDTVMGKITISCNGDAITSVHFGIREVLAEYRRTEQTDRAAIQLDEYFAGKRRSFDVILYPTGTSFQKSVWAALQAIPYGETRSYKQVAKMVGKPSASRAVGMANNKNPIMIMIPCHRVVGSDGLLVGYAAGLQVKERLLLLEKENVDRKGK